MFRPIGLRIKKLREDRLRNENKSKWSLEALAKRINVSSQSLSKIETGKTINPNISIVKSLAEEFGVTIDYLVYGHNKHSKISIEITGDPLFLENIKQDIIVESDD